MSTTHTKVAIIGGDPVVGEALEVLLQTAGYRARFLSEPGADKLGEMLADSQLLVVAPTLSVEHRKAVLEIMLSPQTPVNIPVLQLLPANGGQHLQGEHVLLWPCSTEDLRRAVDTALLAQQ
jgi:hypothetical protein